MTELNPQPLPPDLEAWKDPSTAPPWWLQLLWQLHFPVVDTMDGQIVRRPGNPGPINPRRQSRTSWRTSTSTRCPI